MAIAGGTFDIAVTGTNTAVYTSGVYVVNGAVSYVTLAVEGTSDLASGVWDVPVESVTLSDVTRAGFRPVEVDGAIPAFAAFRLKLTLGE